MLKIKFFVVLAAVVVASCENKIPEKYKNAQPISAHPRYQQQLEKKFPKALNGKSEVNPIIIGGSAADRGQFPHHVMIFIVFPTSTYLCGGSIIDQNWVLTAAHCVIDGAEYFELFTGIINFQGPYSWYSRVYPKDTFIHQEYNENTLVNDIALIKLVDAPENLFGDPFIAPIALPVEYVDLVDKTGTIIGFGRESDNSSSISEVLKFNSLKAITNEQCASYFVSGAIQQSNLCAETNAEASTCNGDSGGSFTFSTDDFNRLEGITSFGAQLGCQLGYPAGFTRVTYYLKWIEETINGGATPPPDVDNRGILKKILEKILEILRKIFGRY